MTLAAKGGHVHVMEYLLKNTNETLTKAAMEAAMIAGKVNVLEWSVRQGAAQPDHTRFYLHANAEHEQLKICNFVVKTWPDLIFPEANHLLFIALRCEYMDLLAYVTS